MAVKTVLDMGSEQTVGRTSTEILVSALGYSNKTKAVSLYAILLTMKEPVTGLSTDNLQSGNYGINSVKASNGTNVAPTILDEEDPSAEISIQMKEDLNFVRKNAPFGVNRSILNAIFKGESFYVGNDEIIAIVGTNGTMKSKTARAKANEMNLPFKALFGLEADEIKVTGAVDPKTGKIATRKNTFRNAYDTFNKTVCLEFRVVANKTYVMIMPLIATTGMTKDEGDVNTYTVSGNRLCDTWERDDYVMEVGETSKLNVDEELDEIVVDGIVLDPSTATAITGITNPLLCKVTATGDITLSKGSATLKGKLKKNTRIKARYFSDTGTTFTEQNAIVVVGETDGTGLTGKAVNFALGSGNKFYACKVFVYDRNLEDMNPYQTVDAI
ncbi:putative A32-like protein [Fusobacterium phage vB_FnuS_FNU3]|uniref:Type I secretion system permease/ATPase n=1 Tax=Fusobacterium phage Fnu1 TaxID=2530024 RepID=A0A481W6Q8_9CAUD|nr:type I secretion system permease/ATPase [Fusobacterium phage Fnu1]QBJ04071.1 type I secretion system permease/ATPase [Fusobacterium phage Fnu1]WGH50202.1 putative A32-like protein [Fusobacterium phage vB_FnuS_FNU2]WGH50349.1 putative A32-like protein [Fusobacterium phage vB_FnuS_FNU3]